MSSRARTTGPARLAAVALCAALVALGAPAAATDGGAVADPVARVALYLAVVLGAAKLGGDLATRAKQPAVLGELVAGLVLANLPWTRGLAVALAAHPTVDMLARLGVLVLLFQVGLESTVREVLSVGAAALRVAVIGTAATLALGYVAASWLLPGSGAIPRLFVGAAITATSVGISARVLKDLGESRSPEARTILGAAIVDDVIGLIVLALVTGMARRGMDGGAGAGGATGTAGVAWLVGKTVLFLGLSVGVGYKLSPALFRAAARLRAQDVLLVLALVHCFVLAWGAAAIGLAPMVGAFAAGLVLEDLHSTAFVQHGERPLAESVAPLAAFLVPVFFVLMGLRTDVRLFAEPRTLALAAVLTVVAVLGKLACAGGVGRGADRLVVALGMVPRGEVSLIFADAGRSLRAGGVALVDERVYAALVLVVLLTTVLTPPGLVAAFRRARRPTPGVAVGRPKGA